MSYIYKITNDFDNKIYIGKTTRSVELRFEEHYKKTSGSNSYIDNDMALKGKEHFKYEIIEECSAELLSEREKYWIAYYHSYIKDPLCKGGYNLTPGGEGKSLSEKQINDIKKLWEEEKTIVEISNILNLPHSTIYHRVSKYDNFDKQKNKIKAIQHLCKSVDQYDINGNYIKTFNSISDAIKEINANKTSEIGIAIKKGTVCHGFRWALSGDKLIFSKNKKKVAKIDINTNEILEIFDGAREAARQMNVDSSGIIRACNGQQKTCKGYKWRYLDE